LNERGNISMCHQIIASFGLILDIIGVVFLFIWGPPAPNMEGSVGLALESGTVLADGTKVKDMEKEQLRKRVLHTRMSKVGLGLILFGFVLQLIAQWF
jgi:hypothetical protein